MSKPIALELPDDVIQQIAERVALLLADRATPAETGYLDAVAAADYLSTTRDRVYDLVQLGKLNPCRDGRRLLFKRSELDAYIESAG